MLFRSGIPGEAVDGMSVLAVREAGMRAVAHAKSGKGPYILEMKTYRYRGHSMSDPAKYRTKEEVDQVKKERDPLDHIKALMEGAGLKEGDWKVVDDQVKAVVLEAVEFSQSSPEPDPSELYTDVYLEA